MEILVNSEKYRVYSLNEQCIVYRSSNASLHLLDDLPAWLLLALDAGLNKTEIQREALKNQISVDQLNSAFREIDKLLDSNFPPSSYRQEYTDLIQHSVGPELVSSPLFSVSLIGKYFHLDTNCPRFANYLQTLSSKLQLDDGNQIDYQIFIEHFEDTYHIKCNDFLVAEVSVYEKIMPILMDHMQILAYQSSHYLMAVHSAMLMRNGKGLMLPGKSGSGKSTLCLSLLKKGFSCYSDEISVLSLNDHQLMPIPLPAAIKSGSWNIMSDDFPDITSLPVWHRTDGRRLKYIDFPIIENNLKNVPVSCIVFPHYSNDYKTCKLEPINSVAALAGLTEAGYQIKDDLTAEKVEQILEWISQTPAYHLRYSNLYDAHKAIHQLLK
ncbi:MAG: Unknown protein [uncultured Thiotrichaceae bacterium]|uniref:HPr kinase n=1 Tax=uncultured Thiotrichaceae bacterium TaxID=298394 RepID=A0A6S6TWE0_9GAMM|nr:MAG: Unknown protein [uncultured Thiotrichaceae bacterium]